jgi:hypothetical protein
VRAFMVALAEGVDPQSALATSFGPATAAAVSALPDYFGWVLFQDPMETLGGGPDTTSSFRRWPRIILTQFDSSVEPWARDGRFFRHVLPEVTTVSYVDGWAVIMPGENDGIGEARFFRQVDGAWSPSLPDESILGEATSSTIGAFTIHYYAWDEAFVPDLGQALNEVYEGITADFGLTWEAPFVVSVHPSFGVSPPYAGTSSDIAVDSPRLAQSEDMVISQAVYELAGILLSPTFGVDRIPEERVLLLLGAFLWEMDQLARLGGHLAAPRHHDGARMDAAADTVDPPDHRVGSRPAGRRPPLRRAGHRVHRGNARGGEGAACAGRAGNRHHHG